MQAHRLLIKLCLAAAPFAAQAGDVKVSVRVDGLKGWHLALLLLAPAPAAPVASAHHLRPATPTPPASGLVYVGGVQYRLPPPPPPRD